VPSAFEIILDRGTAGIEYRFSAGVKGTQDASAIRDSRSVGWVDERRWDWERDSISAMASPLRCEEAALRPRQNPVGWRKGR